MRDADMLRPPKCAEGTQRWRGTFPGKRNQVREVRRFVNGFLGEGVSTDIAELVASELATNAIRHSSSGEAGGRFQVTVEAGDELLLLAVLDEGGPSCPQVQKAADEEMNGRGLRLVSELTASWGVYGDEGGRTVWALLPIQSGPPRA
ncbi:ATP-binding protein [Planotetraspora kaengkrachanensis]|uniref:ATP-binding protein n=1 Tax=Planotetraspora kaengkrachanensis TaxID=575193 RepID=UPI0019418714|nr:ATP-binding protein [Planotetraspora kaengkrachanensis]